MNNLHYFNNENSRQAQRELEDAQDKAKAAFDEYKEWVVFQASNQLLEHLNDIVEHKDSPNARYIISSIVRDAINRVAYATEKMK